MIRNIKSVFGIIFGCLFLYLPYIAGTTYRYDHLFTIIILLLFLTKYLLDLTSIIKPFFNYFLFYSCFMIITVIFMLLTPGPIIFLVKVVNSFSYPLLAITLLLFYRKFIFENFNKLMTGLMLLSIVFNIIAIMQYFRIEKDFLISLMDYYGGEIKEGYKGYGSLAALTSIAGRRSASIFAHPMAFGVQNMILISYCMGCLKNIFFFKDEHYKKRNIGFLCFILLLNIIGGVFAMSKTYFFSLIFILLLEGAHMFYLAKLKISFKQGSTVLLILVILFFLAKEYIMDDSGYFRTVIEMIVNLDFDLLFKSRFGKKGYLEETGTMDAAMETFNFLFGMGRGISKYAWADSGYLQALMVGGVFYAIIYYCFIFTLLYKLAVNKYLRGLSTSYSILVGVLLIANSGVFVFIFPRVSFLLFLLIFFLLCLFPYYKDKMRSNIN